MFKPSWKFAEEIIARGCEIFTLEELRTVYGCIQCGNCTGSCPAGRRTSLITRMIIRMIQLGMRDDVLRSEDLWACTTCYTCQERCPRQIVITDIIKAARNIAFEEGFAKKRHIAVAGNLVNTGHSIPVNDEVKRVRIELGLSEIPPTTLNSTEALAEINKIMKLDNFLTKIEKV